MTERYVATAVEGLAIIDTEAVNLQPLLEALARLRVVSPVTADNIDVATKKVDVSYRAMYKRTPDFVPRVLKTLNGPAYRLVPYDIVARAVSRERAMAGMVHGWGVCDPPVQAVVHRLLGSCGLDVRHLPNYKTIPPGQRGRIMCAWAGACATLNWYHYEPKADVVAQTRTRQQLDALARAPAVPLKLTA
jgi:hypothetical protein